MVIAPLSLACLMGYALTGDFLGRGIFYYGFLVVALLTATVIFDVLANPRSVIRRVLEMKWLVWIGSISYGLYLWHWTIFWGMHLMGYKGWTVVVVGIPLTFLVVLPSYYFMERPILKLKARFGAGREV
jgi:peptidoglycan/LPS O-acetylase OafA/YrhL